jgi:hypothetical protein
MVNIDEVIPPWIFLRWKLDYRSWKYFAAEKIVKLIFRQNSAPTGGAKSTLLERQY